MFISSEEIQRIRDYRSSNKPQHSLMKAAISIVLRKGELGTEFLLMQRAKHDSDPWSGQMSFPGGKIEASDASAKEAAVRETFEEVGIELLAEDYIGQLDDLYGLKVNNQYSVHVECFVFMPIRELTLKGNREVADMVWLPLSYLDDPNNSLEFFHPMDGGSKMPAVLIDEAKEQILWGLSLRMLATFFELLDRPMRVLDNDDSLRLREMDKKNMSATELDETSRKALKVRA